jgi:hypothetical protein
MNEDYYKGKFYLHASEFLLQICTHTTNYLMYN